MHGRWKALGALHVVMLFLWSAAPIPADEPAVFPLTESSILDALNETDPQSQMMLYRVVQRLGTTCTPTPIPEVVYPKLNSAAPLYGRLPLMDNDGKRMDVDFVADESQPAADEPAVKEPAEEVRPPLLQQLGEAMTGAAQAPPQTQKYDLLYVDINGDRDLTNDAPLRPMKEPPKIFGSIGVNPATIMFDVLEIKQAGEGASTTADPLRVLPQLYAGVRGQRANLIVMTTAVRKGRICLGNTWYEAIMGASMRGPNAALFLRPESADATQSPKPAWRMLGFGLQQSEGKYYDLAASTTGDQITVAPYTGAMGELRIEPGDRQVAQFGAAGALRMSTGSVIWLGEAGNYYSEERVRTSQIPVGDYQLSAVTVACGDMLVRLSGNVRRLSATGQSVAGPPAFPIAIRADQPFTLRFADQPTVVFLDPAPNSNPVVKRGATIRLGAMLLDPVLDGMVRGLDDTKQSTGERSYQGPDGEVRKIPVYTSLIPRVTITNAAGKEVADGPMPFG